jgi:hypothetical protein
MLRLKRATEVPGVIEQSVDMDIRLGVELLLTQRVPVRGGATRMLAIWSCWSWR